MENASAKNINYNSFDLAKLICAVLVVMIHVDPFGEQVNTNIFSYLNFGLGNYLCRIAVPMFFVFSGFLLYRKTPLDKFSLKPSKKYLLNILKLYLLWSLIYFPLNLIGILQNPNGIVFALALYARNFIFMGSYLHLWYLTALLFAVALISFLLYIKLSAKKILCISSVCYLIGLLGDAYYGLISPLLDVPVLGQLINIYFTLIGTVRNGLFFAFFFVALGMFLSQNEIPIGRKKSLLLFTASIFMLGIEVFCLKYFNIAKDFNILLFTVPTALFGFTYLRNLKLKDGNIYATMRKFSSLIFYGHMWVSVAVSKFANALGFDIKATPIPFIITLTVTILIAAIVIKISEKKAFVWLKIFY